MHGVTDFGVPLSPQHVTAAELLKKHGYQTAAFIGAIILDSNSLAPGLDRGFDFYDNFPKTDSRSADGRNDGRWGRVERRGMEVVEHAETWFDKHRAGPHFVWVHLYDPHDPYEPPPPFSEKYKDHLYDGEIAYADSTIARWIAFLKKAGVYDNAIIVVTGDHGEGLGEHGEETHGLFLYDSTLHIPLILKMPGTAHRATVVDTQVRTTDILPTILAATGVAPPAELNGESLLPLIAENPGTPSPSGRPLFGETDYPLRWGWAPLRALRADNTKWIEAPRPELYDLQADPKELKDLYAPASAKARSMQAAIAEWEAKLPPRSGAGNTVQPLPDPKDKIEVQNLLHNAMLASDDHRSSEARQYLEKALQIDPTSPTAHRQLGELEFSTGDFSKAAVHLKRAAELRPEDPTALFELGEAMEKSGDWPGARDALESSLKMSPSQISARLLLGRVYLQLKDAKNAADPVSYTHLQGQSLVRIAKTNPDADQSAYARSDFSQEAFGWSALESWRAGKFLYIRAPQAELYDLVADPGAGHNLAQTSKATLAALAAQLEAFDSHFGDLRGKSATEGLSSSEMQKLASLGYVGLQKTASASNAAVTGTDPKDEIATANRVLNALASISEGKPDRAIAVLEQAVAAAPNMYLAQ